MQRMINRTRGPTDIGPSLDIDGNNHGFGGRYCCQGLATRWLGLERGSKRSLCPFPDF